MDLKWQGRNYQIDDNIREYATKKLNRLDRLLPQITLAEVEVSSSTTRSQSHLITVQVTIKAGGATLRAEQRAATANTAMDSVVDILERQIAKFKSQTYRSKRAKRITPLSVVQAEEAERTDDIREGGTPADADKPG